MVFTDPPYNVDYQGYTDQHLKIQGDCMSPPSSALSRGHLCSYRMASKPTVSFYMCHPSSWQREFQNALRRTVSKSVARSSGPRTPSPGDSGGTNSSTNPSSIPRRRSERRWFGDSRSPLYGRRTSRRLIEFTQPRNPSSLSSVLGEQQQAE